MLWIAASRPRHTSSLTTVALGLGGDSRGLGLAAPGRRRSRRIGPSAAPRASVPHREAPRRRRHRTRTTALLGPRACPRRRRRPSWSHRWTDSPACQVDLISIGYRATTRDCLPASRGSCPGLSGRHRARSTRRCCWNAHGSWSRRVGCCSALLAARSPALFRHPGATVSAVLWLASQRAEPILHRRDRCSAHAPPACALSAGSFRQVKKRGGANHDSSAEGLKH